MKLQVVTIPFILLSVFSACGLAQETELLTIKKIGTRTLEYGKRSYSFPWYHVKADHNQIWFGKVWSGIRSELAGGMGVGRNGLTISEVGVNLS